MWPFRKSLANVAEKASDDDLVNAVIDRMPRSYDDFTATQRGVWAVRWLMSETNNGTIEQYFTNSTADDYPLLCRFLEEIQASETLDKLTDFGQNFGSPDEHFPKRRDRVEFVTAQEDYRGDEWEALVRNATESISRTFGSVITKLAVHIRNNIETTER